MKFFIQEIFSCTLSLHSCFIIVYVDQNNVRDSKESVRSGTLIFLIILLVHVDNGGTRV
jgi:hypothetical protein